MPNFDECVICNGAIQEDLLKKRYCQPEFPHIPIGPYCRTCLGKVRLCTGCNHPFENGKTIQYFGAGRYYCKECAKNIEACGVCGEEGSIHKVIDGVKWCSRCFNKKWAVCKCCEDYKLKTEFVTKPLTRLQYKGYFKKYGVSCKTCFNENNSRFKKYNVRECKHCNSLYTSDASHGYCDNCFVSFKKCGCGKQDPTVRRYNISTKGSDRLQSKDLCSSCSAPYKTCKVCHAISTSCVKVGSLVTELICPTCNKVGVNMCKSCMRIDMLSDGHCSRCASTYFNNRCGTCDRIKDDRGNCRVCGDTQIYNYSKKNLTNFHFTAEDEKNKERIFFGIENETRYEGGSERDRALTALYSHFGPDFMLAKHDASIGGPGFEIVTQPMTLDFFHNWNVKDLFQPGIVKTTSCGMHVHVDRRSFLSDLHVFKIVNFLHQEVKKVDKIVGRSYNHYNGKLSSKPSTTVMNSKKGMASRSLRVNLSNKVTIEFRMFAHCNNEYEMRYRIEFLHSIIRWSASSSITAAKSWENYTRFVRGHKALYPHLIRFIDKRSL